MTLEAPMRCSALAEQLGEPMIGTVDQREHTGLPPFTRPKRRHVAKELVALGARELRKFLNNCGVAVRIRWEDPSEPPRRNRCHILLVRHARCPDMKRESNLSDDEIP